MNGAAEAQTWAMHAVESRASCWVLVASRLSGVMVFAPVFSSPAIPMRVRSAFVLAMTLLIAPTLSSVAAEPGVASVLGELSVGLAIGLSLALLTEMLNFAGALLSMEFSFSLVNLMDPNSRVETAVLGQLLGWVGVLVMLGAGLHRTLLGGVIASFERVPPGHAVLLASSAPALARLAAGVFLVGVQLASPVMAAAMTVEVSIALVARLAPQLPAMVLSIPFKTAVSYVVLVGSLAVWPWLLERRFLHLLDAAWTMVGTQ